MEAAFRIPKWIRIPSAIVLIIVGAYGVIWPTISWNQEMSITVEADGHRYTGSSIVTVYTYYQPTLGLLPQTRRRFSGQAPFVELPGGRFVFALLAKPADGDYAGYLASELWGRAIPNGVRRTIGYFVWLSRPRAATALPRSLYPEVVSFRDIADPRSIERLDPADLFPGSGVLAHVTEITLSITPQPPEKKIEAVLPWLSAVRDNSDSGKQIRREISKNWLAGSLLMGLKR